MTDTAAPRTTPTPAPDHAAPVVRKGLWSRLWRRSGRVSGWWWLWLFAAAVLAGLAGSLPSLTLFTLAAGLVVTVAGGAAVTVTAALRLSISRSVPVREAHEDAPVVLEFTVRLPSWLPARVEVLISPGGWVQLNEGGGTVELFVDRRGAHLLEPSKVRVGDPFGIVRRGVRVGVSEPVLILPGIGVDTPISPPRGARADDLEPDGLRPYVPGSPTSRIHWASLARGGELQERRMVAPPTGLPLVIVDTSGATDPRAVDWVARAAAGSVLALARGGGCEVLLPGAPYPLTAVDEASWRAVHRRLAILDTDHGGHVRIPPGGRASSVIHAPPGLDLGPQQPRLPPGVLPMPPASAEELIATLGGRSREMERVA